MLNRRLARLALRLRLAAGVDGARQGLALGLIAALGVVAAGKCVPIPNLLPIALLAAAGGILVGAIASASRRVTPLSAAILADRAAGTHEVISTACEFRENDVLTREAERLLNALPDSALIPRRPSRLPWAPALLAAALVGLFFIPSIPWSSGGGRDPAAL
ncbi:MAG: hypothetical protein L0170_20100, partial [Acidobacteria bacterium]|nr:hypothetical protein [Acidobacteriota bacterium]